MTTTQQQPIQFNNQSEHFAQLRWVARAIDTKGRHPLNCLSVEDNRIIGTDGRRLHIAHFSLGLEPGLYYITKNTKKEIQLIPTELHYRDYPDVDAIMPEHTNYFESRHRSEHTNHPAIIAAGLGKQDIAVNPAYLMDLEEESSQEEYSWEIFYGSGQFGAPVVCKGVDKLYDNPCRLAVIMPVNYEQPEFKTLSQTANPTPGPAGRLFESGVAD